MTKAWTEELLGTRKPIIAMCHLNSLPGDPYYNAEAGMKGVVEWARRDFLALQNGGVDAVMFSNEFSVPYMTEVDPVTLAAMARVIGELMPDIRIPFGVDVQCDPYRTLDLAVAVGAVFVREVFSGVYASDFGLWSLNTGKIVRHQHAVGARDVKLLFNIVPEAAVYLEERDIVEIARSTVFNHRPDALLISGLNPGAQTNTQTLKLVKDAVPNTVVFANTGLRVSNVEEQFSIADGGIVGTTFKIDGEFKNHVDEARVKEFMDKVKSIRE
jgi:membrane complex biogenesis BtpA family protein